MNTQLQEFTSEDNYNKIAELTGAYVGSSAVYLPRLTVNRMSTDTENNPLPMGQFTITQDEQMFFSKKATFRIFLNRYQYQQYDPVSDKYIHRSVIIKNFGEEAFDDAGGLACGKLPAKVRETLSPEQQAQQKHIKCNRLLYGTVTFEENVTNVPCVMKLSGGNFMAFDDAIKAFQKMKHQFFQHESVLNTKRHTKGSNVYYEVLVSPVYETIVPFTEEDMETFNLFREVIDRENNFVTAKWREVKKSKIDEIDVVAALAFDDPIGPLA